MIIPQHGFAIHIYDLDMRIFIWWSQIYEWIGRIRINAGRFLKIVFDRCWSTKVKVPLYAIPIIPNTLWSTSARNSPYRSLKKIGIGGRKCIRRSIGSGIIRIINPINSNFSIAPASQASYIKIPINALVEGYKEKANIYILDGKKAKKVSIQPLFISNDFFTIDESVLAPSSQVITEGAAYLKDNIEVNVLRENSQAMK